MRAGATAFSGIGATKLMLYNGRSARNEYYVGTLSGCQVDDLDVDGVVELFERSSSCDQ